LEKYVWSIMDSLVNLRSSASEKEYFFEINIPAASSGVLI